MWSARTSRWGTLWLATPQAIVNAWMASPGHRANILDAAYRETGVGVSPQPPASLAEGQAGAIYTQDFGTLVPTGHSARHTPGSSTPARRLATRSTHGARGSSPRPAHGRSPRRSPAGPGRITSAAQTSEQRSRYMGVLDGKAPIVTGLRARHRARHRRAARRARRAGAHQRSRQRHRKADR